MKTCVMLPAIPSGGRSGMGSGGCDSAGRRDLYFMGAVCAMFCYLINHRAMALRLWFHSEQARGNPVCSPIKAISAKENTILLVFLLGFGVAPAVT